MDFTCGKVPSFAKIKQSGYVCCNSVPPKAQEEWNRIKCPDDIRNWHSKYTPWFAAQDIEAFIKFVYTPQAEGKKVDTIFEDPKEEKKPEVIKTEEIKIETKLEPCVKWAEDDKDTSYIIHPPKKQEAKERTERLMDKLSSKPNLLRKLI